MRVAPGTRLGEFEIVAPIGAGGMGEVFRARDTRLGRDVALKILPEMFAADAERLERFEREARTLAALNHPHIAQIHGIVESQGVRALVMELVEGEDLAARLARGPIPLDEALPLARQIAQALEAAHQQGVVHRDLKPANIKMRPDGTAKVLDFGLAKMRGGPESGIIGEPAGPGFSAANSPTFTNPAMTAAGLIIGTAAYMAPEQAKGKPVDKRADIWAFGVVLFEMLVGRTLFRGDSVTDVLAAVVRDAPDWNALPQPTPSSVRRLLRRSLEKDPARRLDSMTAALLEIDDALAGTDEPGVSAAPKAPHVRYLAMAAIAGLLVGWVATRFQPAAPSTVPLRKFDLRIPDLQPGAAAISPDATKIGYVAGGRLWIRDVTALTPRLVPGPEGVGYPFWSPDSRTIGYGAAKKLWKADAAGGTPVPICDLPETGSIIGGSWSTDGTIAFGAWRGALYEVPSGGGDPRVRLQNDPAVETDFHAPQYLSGSRDLLFGPHLTKGGVSKIELLSGTNRQSVLEIADGGIGGAAYSQSGHLLYVRTGTNEGVWAVPFDSSRRVSGEPFRVHSGAVSLSLAADETLLLGEAPEPAPSQLVWLERDGRVAASIGRPQSGLGEPMLSPDGRRVAVSAAERSGHDIWLVDLERGTMNRVTSAGEDEHEPAWSADGRTLYFVRATSRQMGLLTSISADGLGEPRPLVPGRNPAVSPDGRSLYHSGDRRGTRIPLVAPILSDGSVGPAVPLGQVASAEEGRISPDGRLIAYTATQSGQPEIFISRFPDGVGRWQVSIDGGRFPRWAKKSGELFFVAGSGATSGQIAVVTVQIQPSLAVGNPTPLFELKPAGIEAGGFEVTADGKRFIAVRASSQTDAARLTIVQNWIAEFKKP